jgi:hypothetical protein
VPLTDFQQRLLRELSASLEADRYLAGGAALHFAPQSTRYSDDLDFFHDTEERVAAAFGRDRDLLRTVGYAVEVTLSLPGFIRAVVSREGASTRVDWARDSTWRFMPLVRDPDGGWLLHPIDVAVNKVLALAGRDEARDYVDALFAHRTILPIAGLVWAAVGKDPGLSPLALLELLRRHGRPRPEEVARLQLTEPFDLVAAKAVWLEALAATDRFVRERPVDELGCLYFHRDSSAFVLPRADRSLEDQGLTIHFGSPGGVIPRVVD